RARRAALSWGRAAGLTFRVSCGDGNRGGFSTLRGVERPLPRGGDARRCAGYPEAGGCFPTSIGPLELPHPVLPHRARRCRLVVESRAYEYVAVGRQRCVAHTPIPGLRNSRVVTVVP